MNNIYYVKSKKTGGHYAFKTEKSKKPFENPLNYYAKLKLFKDDIVADIGAYVGEYSLYAIRQGVKKVIAYEPTPESFNLLQKNIIGNIEAKNLAVIGDDRELVRLYLSKGIGVTNSTAKKINKSGYIEVPAINYISAVKNSSVVKIDVEGQEYDYDIIQPNLRGIILEFHPLAHTNWKDKAYKIMDKIENAGYKSILKPKFSCGWDLTGCWQK